MTTKTVENVVLIVLTPTIIMIAYVLWAGLPLIMSGQEANPLKGTLSGDWEILRGLLVFDTVAIPVAALVVILFTKPEVEPIKVTRKRKKKTP